MTNTPLNPDALEAAAMAVDGKAHHYSLHLLGHEVDDMAKAVITAYLAAAQPVAQKLTDAEWREFQMIPVQGYSHRAWVDALIAERVAAAQPEADTVDYLATPLGHYDAWTDTGDGYTQRKGWTLTCLWCGVEFTGATKGEALKGYEAHEEKILQVLRAEDAERAKNRPEVKE
ncbi:hypothetical protein [Glutamicibacter ardleyensis]|uniref:hypothetical protein n=1 Tax=Glutamicibacter ardleyensis TaxID=225894 RepID=UPI003FCFCE97